MHGFICTMCKNRQNEFMPPEVRIVVIFEMGWRLGGGEGASQMLMYSISWACTGHTCVQLVESCLAGGCLQ